MGTGSGFGKVILFNEHFVVHGIPAIVSAIDLQTTSRVDRHRGKEFVLDDQRPATEGYKDEKRGHQRDSLHLIFQAMGIEQSSLKITLGGNLVAASGIGASAASCVAIARALDDEFHLGLTDEEINRIAFEGEKGYHGSPSGIDNTAATYGGLIWFQRGNPPVMERLTIGSPVEIVMGNTGTVANTKMAVEKVQKGKENNPRGYQRMFKEAENIAHQAKDSLLKNHLAEVGEYMNHNHVLLQKIEVSSKDLDFLVEVARDTGALGAKMTGGGLGGYMVALTPGKRLQDEVARAIAQEGFMVLKARIGV